MPPPTAEQIRVATEALRTEAGVWDAQAAQLNRIGPMTEALRLNRVEAGLFQVIFDTYQQVIDQVVARADEGGQRMDEIATTLRQVADTYDREEAANTHMLNNIY
jgi:uncharacterized protein YukE